jgi:hypothetical protein
MVGSGDPGEQGKDSAWPARDLTLRATRAAAWLALTMSLALTAAAWRFADAREQQAGRAELQGRVAQLAARLSTRMLT